jgi:Fe-S-cluster containining protein
MDCHREQPALELLKKTYALYHEALSGLDAEPVCREKCSSCCTCNATLTSLEAGFLMDSLGDEEKKDLEDRIRRKFSEKRYIPRMTTNGFARMCMEEREIPEEENDPAFGVCPLLEDELCMVYEARPFGCRALLSETHCGREGFARVPPLVLTLNTLFLQAIEHLDQNGFSGNLSDMVMFFLSGKSLDGKAGSRHEAGGEGLFVCNEKIPAFMVPPKHQRRLKDVMEELRGLLTGLTSPG